VSHPDPLHDPENSLEEDLELELELEEPMKFTLEIDLENDAFQNNFSDPSGNLAYCLHQVANRIREVKAQDGTVKDLNGNTVGKWKIE
jgi:hypothetical protein